MDIVLEIGTKNYLDDLLSIKKALSHMESLVGCYNGYLLSDPSTSFGWTFFKIQISEEMADIIEKSGMMEGALGFRIGEQLTNFVGHYLETKGSNVRIKKIDYG